MIHPQHNGPRTVGSPHTALRLLLSPALALTLALTLIACSNTPAPTDQNASQSAPAVQVDARSLLDAMLSPADENTVALAIASLPKALTTSTRAVANRHALGVTDRVASLAFGDVTVELYRPGSGARPLLSAAQLDTSVIKLDGLGVGMSAAELYQRLGRPAVASADHVVFRVYPAATTPYELSASLRDDTVTALRWSAYLD